MVVPTCNRPESIGPLVDSLSAQELPPESFEVIVVDDASSEELRQSALGTADTAPAIRILRHAARRGPAASRNTGWRAAAGTLVAFTDDDCRADPGWLKELVASWQGKPDRIVQGRTRAGTAQPLDPLDETQQVWGPGFYETCNIAYPRVLLERISGFDESFSRPCGEDVDLGYRAVEAGAHLVFARDAVVYHAVHRPGLYGRLKRTWRWIDTVKVVKAHPDLRKHLIARCFWKRTHPRLLLALAIFLMARRRGCGVHAYAGSHLYVAHYRATYRHAERPWLTLFRRLPGHLAVDACEIATMVAGSVKYRSVVL